LAARRRRHSWRPRGMPRQRAAWAAVQIAPGGGSVPTSRPGNRLPAIFFFPSKAETDFPELNRREVSRDENWPRSRRAAEAATGAVVGARRGRLRRWRSHVLSQRKLCLGHFWRSPVDVDVSASRLASLSRNFPARLQQRDRCRPFRAGHLWPAARITAPGRHSPALRRAWHEGAGRPRWRRTIWTTPPKLAAMGRARPLTFAGTARAVRRHGTPAAPRARGAGGGLAGQALVGGLAPGF